MRFVASNMQSSSKEDECDLLHLICKVHPKRMNGIFFICHLKFVHLFIHPSPRRPRALFPPLLLLLLAVPFAAIEVADLDRCCEIVVEKSIKFLCFCGLSKVAVVRGFSCFLFLSGLSFCVCCFLRVCVALNFVGGFCERVFPRGWKECWQ
jgi:hypothetical protein